MMVFFICRCIRAEEDALKKPCKSTLRRQNPGSESREYLDAIINAISYPVFVKDIHHRLVYVNDAECELAGRGREELIGRTDYDFFPGEQVDIFWKKDDEVLETGRENLNEEDITEHKNRFV